MYGQELFDRLKALALPSGDYVIFGSGPLLVRGIVGAVTDLDVLCRREAWSAVLRLATSLRVEEGVSVVAIGPLTFGKTWGLGGFDTDRLIEDAETIDGLPFAQLEHVIAYKRVAGRPKDLLHLKLIEAWEAST